MRMIYYCETHMGMTRSNKKLDSMSDLISILYKLNLISTPIVLIYIDSYDQLAPNLIQWFHKLGINDEQ